MTKNIIIAVLCAACVGLLCAFMYCRGLLLQYDAIAERSCMLLGRLARADALTIPRHQLSGD